MIRLLLTILIFVDFTLLGFVILDTVNFSDQYTRIKWIISFFLGTYIYSISSFLITYATGFVISFQHIVIFITVINGLYIFLQFRTNDIQVDQLLNLQKRGKLVNFHQDYGLIVYIIVISAFLLYNVIRSYFIPISGWDAVAIFDYKGFTIHQTRSYEFIQPRIEHGLHMPILHATLYTLVSSNDFYIQLLYLTYYGLFIEFFRVSIIKAGLDYNNGSLFTLVFATFPYLLKYLFKMYTDPILMYYLIICFILIYEFHFDPAISMEKLVIVLLLSPSLVWIKTEGRIYYLVLIFLFVVFLGENRIHDQDRVDKIIEILKNRITILAFILSVILFLIWPIMLNQVFQSDSYYSNVASNSNSKLINVTNLWIIGSNLLYYQFRINFELETVGILPIPLFTHGGFLLYAIFWITGVYSLVKLVKDRNLKNNFHLLNFVLLLVLTNSIVVGAFYVSPYIQSPGLQWAIDTAMERVLLQVSGFLFYLFPRVYLSIPMFQEEP